ncbi:hypothetical protein [Arthrobacter sp. efr-133-TYG-104]|uniref:hypothetical protein n=1 Tax=Arthrobacter sp. efr-133-TYG-104 TaxID=3040324 RepID=UPI00255084EF|nr:hypothetical protein [Arthrobacter sp. efr-133-TYG-104]
MSDVSHNNGEARGAEDWEAFILKMGSWRADGYGFVDLLGTERGYPGNANYVLAHMEYLGI